MEGCLNWCKCSGVAAAGEEAVAIAMRRNWSLYVVHGFLHNVGFDDAKSREAAKMHTVEDEILEEFGYGITYQPAPQCRGKAKRE